MCSTASYVCYGPKADMCSAQVHVRQRQQLETIRRISALKGFVKCESGLIPTDRIAVWSGDYRSRLGRSFPEKSVSCFNRAACRAIWRSHHADPRRPRRSYLCTCKCGGTAVVRRRYACRALSRARRCCTLFCLERILCRSQCRVWLGHIRLDKQFYQRVE